MSLDKKLIRYTDKILNPERKNSYEIIEIPENGLIIKKGEFFLGSSQEIIGSEHYVPIIHAKSGIARFGLFVHITADLIDIGILVLPHFSYMQQMIF